MRDSVTFRDPASQADEHSSSVTSPCRLPQAIFTPNASLGCSILITSHAKSPPIGELLAWLGLSDLFQTFEDLESVVDKEAEIASIRELLDVDDPQQTDEKEPLC